MIIRSRPRGWQLFFIMRGSILGHIAGPLAVTVLLATLATWAHGQMFGFKITLTTIPFSLIGLALAIFLGFRNSASYDRFWEGRKLWGALLIHGRSLSRHICCYVDPGSDPGLTRQQQRQQVLRVIGYGHALRHYLRGSDPAADLAPWLSPEELEGFLASRHRPEYLCRQMARQFQAWQDNGQLSPMMAAQAESELTGLSAVVAGCERILYTPLPFSYTLLLHRTAYLYCFLLPFGLVDSIGFMTPLVVAIVSYTFFGLDAVGDEIEEPFGTADNDLPLEALCRSLEINLLDVLGDVPLPPPLAARDFCLS